MKPLISFIIPVYNVENYLEECIESIISQNLSSYEVLLINDGSTDKSPEICDQYVFKYNYIKVFHGENKGQSFARNKGILEAKGDYIFFLDSDDFYIKGVIKDFERSVKENKEIDLILGKIKIFYEGTKKVHSKASYHNFNKIVGMTGQEAFQYLVKTNQFLVSPYSFMVKRSILTSNKIMFDEELRCAEDILFTPKVYFHSQKVSVIDKYFLKYRKNREGQITQNINVEKEKIVLSVLDNLIKEAELMEIKNDTKKSLKRFAANIYTSSLGKHNKNLNDHKNERIYLLREYKHLIKYSGGLRYTFPKYIYILFGFKACMGTLNIMKKVYDNILFLKRV